MWTFQLTMHIQPRTNSIYLVIFFVARWTLCATQYVLLCGRVHLCVCHMQVWGIFDIRALLIIRAELIVAIQHVAIRISLLLRWLLSVSWEHYSLGCVSLRTRGTRQGGTTYPCWPPHQHCVCMYRRISLESFPNLSPAQQKKHQSINQSCLYWHMTKRICWQSR